MGTRRVAVFVAALGLTVLLGTAPLMAANVPGQTCEYTLTTATGETGTAVVKVNKFNILGQLVLKIRTEIMGAHAENLYTVWVDFQSRATGAPAPDYQAIPNAVLRGVAPAFAADAGATSGVTPDPNAKVTNGMGIANIDTPLDYNLLAHGQSPAVHMNLAMQGANIVGGFWIRQYVNDLVVNPQLTGEDPTVPLLARATPFGITVVRHCDKISHGYSPGNGGTVCPSPGAAFVDHVGAFFGDFPASCLP